jgi:O-antigen/teichoic acid export membrane protein
VGGVAQVASAFYPASARSGVNPSIRRIYLRIQLGLFALGLLAIGAYSLIGYSFLIWWLKDPELVGTIHSFILVYRYYGLLLLITPLASTVLDSTGHPGTTSLFGTIAFAIELIFALLLLPHYGLLAPAYAGIISLGIMVPMFLIFTGKILSRGGSSARSVLS